MTTNASDIYAFTFEVLDESRLTKCAVEPSEIIAPASEEPTEPSIEYVDPAGDIGGVVLAAETDTSEISEDFDSDISAQVPLEVLTPPEVATEAEPVTQERESQPPSEAAMLSAAQAIDTYLQGSPRSVVSMAELSHIAFGKAIPRKAFKDFARAVRADIRLAANDSGDLQVLVDKDGRFITDATANENAISTAQMSWLADEAISTLLSNAPYPQLTPKQLLGTVRSFGMFLTNDETHEFFAKIATDPRLVPLPDGSFRFVDSIVGDSATESSSTNKSGLSKAELRKEEKEERTAEIRAIKDSGKKAKANPRIRGRNFRRKGSRMQGRAHNHTKTLDELIAEMNKEKSTDKKSS